MEGSERPAGRTRPNNATNDCTRGEHHPASNGPGALQGNMHASPNKGDHQQNKKTLVILPKAGDDYLQQQDLA